MNHLAFPSYHPPQWIHKVGEGLGFSTQHAAWAFNTGWFRVMLLLVTELLPRRCQLHGFSKRHLSGCRQVHREIKAFKEQLSLSFSLSRSLSLSQHNYINLVFVILNTLLTSWRFFQTPRWFIFISLIGDSENTWIEKTNHIPHKAAQTF